MRNSLIKICSTTAMVLIIFTFTSTMTQAQNMNVTDTQQKATEIFKAWQKAEFGQGYDSFKTFLNEKNFEFFSHPLLGSYKGKEAFDKFYSLVREREVKPNNLTFHNIVTYAVKNVFFFQFDSEGKTSGGYTYKGFNIIQIEIKEGELVGFREYFGFVDPAWFK